MSDTRSSTVVNLEAAQTALRNAFLGWQCRLRQLAVRQAGGRPTAGMRPVVMPMATGQDAFPASADAPRATRITVLIIKAQPDAVTAQWRHMVRKTQDPADRYDAALKFLAAAYYQRPQEFSDRMTALFGPASGLAGQLLDQQRCRLDFEQYRQRYRIYCSVRQLAEREAAYQATYWHNSLFNPNLPGGVQILEFQPDWARSEGEP